MAEIMWKVSVRNLTDHWDNVLQLFVRLLSVDYTIATLIKVEGRVKSETEQRSLGHMDLWLVKWISNQVRIPAELKHISKRRKRN
jgi:hypothetical protein